MNRLIAASRRLAKTCEALPYGKTATHIYHPLMYARACYETYLTRYANPPKKAVFVGINPGPWGMAQTGIPFGDVISVREAMGIKQKIAAPPYCHPKRPVQGLNCPRREASGKRLWEFFAKQYGNLDIFFADYLVLNYCPVLFLQADGGGVRNITPDKLPADRRQPLYAACDDFMRAANRELNPPLWIGIGGFAETRLQQLFGGNAAKTKIGRIPHPSPASPLANRAFDETAAQQLRRLGLR